MWNPLIYRKYNKNAVFINKYFLEKASKHFLWKKKEKILDIGCGEGGATMELILPKLPQDFKEYIAIDKSPDMINFAKETYKHSKVKFCEYTLPNLEFSHRFCGYFNHVFSLTCLQWIPEAREVLRDMSIVLKSGGQALMTVVITCQFDAFSDLYNTKKWQPYLADFQKEKTFPYQWVPDPASYLAGNLRSQNFKLEFCELIDVNILYSKKSFEEFSILVNPYVHRIPQNMKKEFCDDYLQYLLKYPEIEYTTNSNNEVEVIWKHKALGAFVQKI